MVVCMTRVTECSRITTAVYDNKAHGTTTILLTTASCYIGVRSDLGQRIDPVGNSIA